MKFLKPSLLVILGQLILGLVGYGQQSCGLIEQDRIDFYVRQHLEPEVSYLSNFVAYRDSVRAYNYNLYRDEIRSYHKLAGGACMSLKQKEAYEHYLMGLEREIRIIDSTSIEFHDSVIEKIKGIVNLYQDRFVDLLDVALLIEKNEVVYYNPEVIEFTSLIIDEIELRKEEIIADFYFGLLENEDGSESLFVRQSKIKSYNAYREGS